MITFGACVPTSLDIVAITPDEAEQLLVDEGLPPTVARCVVDRQDPAFFLDPDDQGRVREFLGHLVECSGVPPTSTDCYVGVITAVVGGDLSGGQLVNAVNSMRPSDRRSVTAGGLECQGLSRDEATCVVEAMEDAFGAAVFEEVRLQLTEDERARLEDLSRECTAPTSSTAPTSTGSSATGAFCESVVASLDELAAVPDGLDAAQLADRMDHVSSRLALAATEVGALAGADVETLAAFLSHMASDLEFLAIARSGAAEPGTVDRIDELVVWTAPVLRAFADADMLASMSPALLASIHRGCGCEVMGVSA